MFSDKLSCFRFSKFPVSFDSTLDSDTDEPKEKSMLFLKMRFLFNLFYFYFQFLKATRTILWLSYSTSKTCPFCTTRNTREFLSENKKFKLGYKFRKHLDCQVIIQKTVLKKIGISNVVNWFEPGIHLKFYCFLQ